MKSKADEYWDLLKGMYGEKFLINGMEGNFEGILNRKDDILDLNEPYKINETMIKYRRALGEGCDKCINEFLKVMKQLNLDSQFYDRPMEFLGFYKAMDLSKDHVKDIMIISEAAGPDIATHINCTYGLSNTEIVDTGHIFTEIIFKKLRECSENLQESFNLLKVKKTELNRLDLDKQIKEFRNNLENNLWERLYSILPISLENLKNKVYITDLVKCNARGNTIWKHFKDKCYENFLIHEIRIINPKLIIFLGTTGYDYLKEKFEFDEFCPTTDNGSDKHIPEEHPEYSKYSKYNFRSNKYLKIYYENVVKDENKQKNFGNKPFSDFSQEDKKKLMSNQKIPTTFPTFGTMIFEYESIRTPIKFIKIFHNSRINNSRWKVYTKDYKKILEELEV